jgi:hypothetical protein
LNERQKVAAEKATDNQRLQPFKEQVGHYLSEARAGARLLTISPSLDEATTKSKQITDLYIHLPDVPPEIDSTGSVATKLKSITGVFAVGEDAVKVRLDAERQKNIDGFKKAHGECRNLAREVDKLADDIESLVGPPVGQSGSKDQIFKQKLAHFLKEARAAANMLMLAPSLDEATTKARQISNLYLYLPAVPPEIDPTGGVADKLERLENQPNIGANLVKLLREAEQLGDPIAISKGRDACRELAKVITKLADEIESRVWR